MARAELIGRVPFRTHVLLLLRLRAQVAANRTRHLASATPALLGALALASVACLLGYGAFALLRDPRVAGSELWTSFWLRLLCFLVSTVFVVWPVLSAGVDEHTELTRFASMPIRPSRLFLVSCAAALFEPRALVFYPTIAGAIAGFASSRPVDPYCASALAFSFVLLNIAWGRATLTLVLNVLRHRRSSEILGAVFLGALFLASLVPPPDVTWLKDLFELGVDFQPQVDERMILGAAMGLGELPPGWMAVGLEALSQGRTAAGLAFAAALLVFAALGFGIAYALLVRFYRGAARPPKPPSARRRWLRRRLPDGVLWTLLGREASDWLRNPKARLLSAVPFFLCILLGMLRARALGEAALGAAADAWLLSALTAYAGLVIGPNFAHNAFAYDGAGLAQLLAAPVSPKQILVAKNLVHFAGALLVGLGLLAFYGVYIALPGAMAAALALLALAGQMPVQLAVGNLLSVLAPRKFHASLRRRDRPPAVTTVVGLLAGSVSLAPAIAVLRSLGREAPDPRALVLLLAWAGLAWLVWWASLPRASALFAERRAQLLRMVARE